MQPVFTALRFGKWATVLKVKPIDSLSYASLLRHFARGMAFSAFNNLDNAKIEMKNLEFILSNDTTLKVNIDNFSSAREASVVADLIRQGTIASKVGNLPRAISLLKQAVIAEDRLIYNEPRDWPHPASQYLADALIKDGKNSSAIAVLNKDLSINPENGWSLNGLQQIYRIANNPTSQASIRARLKAAWKIKDQRIERTIFN